MASLAPGLALVPAFGVDLALEGVRRFPARDVVMVGGSQAVRRPLRRLAAYGSTNRYRPVNRSRASGSNGE